MEAINCRWLTPIIELSDFGGDWFKYDSFLYTLFSRDFIKNDLYFRGKVVRIRKHPKEGDKEQAYFHVTSTNTSNAKDMNDREPDLRRCERIEWIRLLIENHRCADGCCSLPKIWSDNNNGNTRWTILFEEVRFLVILEERPQYYLLITSFYIIGKRQLEKKLEAFKKFQQKTPIS